MALKSPKVREIPYEAYLQHIGYREIYWGDGGNVAAKMFHEIAERTHLPLIIGENMKNIQVDFSVTGIDPVKFDSPMAGTVGFEMKVECGYNKDLKDGYRHVGYEGFWLKEWSQQNEMYISIRDARRTSDTYGVVAFYAVPIVGVKDEARVILDAINERIDYLINTPDINMRRLKPKGYALPFKRSGSKYPVMETLPAKTVRQGNDVYEELLQYVTEEPTEENKGNDEPPLAVSPIEAQILAGKVQPENYYKQKIRDVHPQDIAKATKYPGWSDFLMPIMERTNAKLVVDNSPYEPDCILLRGIIGRNNNPRDLQILTMGFYARKYHNVMLPRDGLTYDSELTFYMEKFHAIVIDGFFNQRRYSVRVDMENPVEAQNLIIDFIDQLPIYS